MAELEHLYVNGVEANSVGGTKYSVILEDTDSAEINAITKSLDAKVSIDNETAEIHESTKQVSIKDTLIRTVPIIVTAESGKEIEYVLTIYKKSALTELESLTVDGVEATQNNFLNYSIVIDRDITEVDLKAIAIYDTAKVNINNLGAETKETTRTISITGETTNVKILVSAEGQEKEYTLTISKKPDTSGLAFVYVNGEEVPRKDDNTYEVYVAVTSSNAEVLAIASVNTSIVQIGTNQSEIGHSTANVSTLDLVNTYVITVTDSEDPEKTSNYTLIIKKPSTDNTLKEIVISNEEMSVKATRVTGTNKYTAKINEKYENLTVTATANYDLAQVAIDTNTYKDRQDSSNIVFNGDTYTLTIKVKSQDGIEAEYILELEKLSSSTNLEYIKVEGVEATKSEIADDTYETTLTSKLEKVSVNARTENENAEVAINDILYEIHEITKQVDMDSKDVTVKINVKAEDETLKTYNLIIHALPDNTKVNTISVNGITATLVPYTNIYQVRVPNTLTEYNVTVTSQDQLAKIKFTDVGANIARPGTNTETIARTGDLTKVNINIMAQDGVTNEDYILEITPMSTNTELSYVKVDGVIIDISDDGQYHVSVANATTEVNIEALTEDLLATVGIDAVGTKNLVTKVGTLTGDITVFDIIVTAEDGITTNTYKLNIEKMSANTDLFQVIVNGNIITPVDGKYTAVIGNNTEAEVKAITSDEKAVVSIDGDEEQLHENTEKISTTDEQKTIEITVKAEDGTVKTHYLTLKRYSSDNTLLSISADGIDEDKITQTSENTYQMVVSNELTKLNLTAVTSNEVAKVKIENNVYEVNTTTKEISIPDDTNTVIITVQAENGEEKEYTLTIIKKYVLTLESITVNGENAIVEENGEYIAWIDPTNTEAQVVVTPNSSKVNVNVGEDISGIGTTTFMTQTPNEENTVKINVSSPIDQDQVEYTLKIMKKSSSTELEYVKVDGNVGTLEEDEITYTVKVPIKTEKYSMEVKTANRYAEVKIENNEYSLETDTYEVDLTGVTTKTVTVTVKSQTGEEKTYKVNIEKVSEDATIKIVKVNNVEITADENGNYLAFIDDTLASVPLYIETTENKAEIKLDDGNQNIHTITENITMDKDQVTMLVTVTAENGTTKTCTLTIQKESSDAEILSVKVDEKDAIQLDETTYYVTAKPGVTEVTINVKSANQYADIQINGSAKVAGENTIKYTLQADTKIANVPIIITSQNGKVVKTYTLQIEQISNNTDLELVKVDGVDATYDEDNDIYRIIIDDAKDEAEVYVKTVSSEASVKIESGDLSKGQATETVSTAAEENNVTISVIAEDGTSVTKTLIIKKLSKDASIIKLYVNGNEIEPAEDGTYTAEVLESIKTSVVKIKTTNANASITINGTLGATLGESSENIDTSTERKIVVPIKITAEDTSIVNETTLTINMVSDTKTLEYVKVNGVEINDYDEKTNTYKAFIPANSTSAKLDIKTVSPYAEINIDEQSATNIITYTTEIIEDITYVYVTVIAEDDSTRTYTVVLQKESTDVTLKELYKDGVYVAPEEDENYIINVSEDTDEITLKATANNEYATVAIGAETAETETTQRKVTLSEGKTTTTTITVTAQNGDIKTYTVSIVKISANNEIEQVKVNSEIITRYDEITKTYIAFIPTNSTSADIEVKAKNSYATLEIGEDSSIGTIKATVEISEDETVTDVKVTAETGDEDTFYIKLLKISIDNSIKEIYVDNVLVVPDDEGNYIAEVLETNISSLVKVIPTNEYAMVQIEDNDPAEGGSEETVILSAERETIVKIKVTSQSGEVLEETLTIRKVSNNANINTVLVNDIECTNYNAETKTYTAYIDEEDDTAKVAVMTKSNQATIVLDKISGTGTVETNVDTTNKTTRVEVTVKSETGTIEKYYIDIIKKSKDVSLELVKVNDIEIAVPYEVKIKKTDTKAKIYVKATDSNAVVKIADEDAELGEATAILNIPLSQDIIVIPVTVTSHDTTEVKTYNITLIRSSNSTGIKEILVNGEVVDLTTFEHIVKNVNSSSIKVTTENENAKVAIDDATPTVNIANATVDTRLSTVRTITVTAEDGTTKEYSLTLIKKVTIEGMITDENIMDKHIAEIIVYQTADTRLENDPINPREEVVAIQTNEDGTYEILLEPGIYDVIFTKPGYLSHRITEIDITDGLGAVLDTVDMVGGDVAQDGEIEIDDLVDMNENVGETITDDNAEEKSIYDLNGDGKIDMLDRSILKANYGKIAKEVKWVKPRKRRKEDVGDEDANLSENTDISYITSSDGTVLVTRIEENYLICPIACDYRISSNYGYRIHPITGEKKLHSGIDLVGKHHTEILTIADGTVTYAGVQNGYGNCIEIKHIVNGEAIYSFYAHLSKIDVKVGEKVEAGKIIGLEGGAETDPNHGTSTGHHLHFEIRTASGSGHSIDPTKYIEF